MSDATKRLTKYLASPARHTPGAIPPGDWRTHGATPAEVATLLEQLEAAEAERDRWKAMAQSAATVAEHATALLTEAVKQRDERSVR